MSGTKQKLLHCNTINIFLALSEMCPEKQAIDVTVCKEEEHYCCTVVTWVGNTGVAEAEAQF